ncbi:MAG: hypothetical protein RR238_03195 [Lachnospiraceae bacterium]
MQRMNHRKKVIAIFLLILALFSIENDMFLRCQELPAIPTVEDTLCGKTVYGTHKTTIDKIDNAVKQNKEALTKENENQEITGLEQINRTLFYSMEQFQIQLKQMILMIAMMLFTCAICIAIRYIITYCYRQDGQKLPTPLQAFR